MSSPLESLQQWLHQPHIIFYFLLLIPCIFFFFSINLVKKPKHKRLPPSPFKLPIIGNLHQLGNHPHRSLRSLADIHGPLMLVHLGSAPFLIATTASAAKEILKTHDLAFSSRTAMKAGARLLYNCKDVSVAPYGEYWRQARRVCVIHLLSATRVRSARAVREEEVAAMLAKIAGSTRPVNLSKALVELTNGITCRVVFGKKVNDEEATSGGIRKALAELLALLGAVNIGDLVPWLTWVDKLNGFESRVEKNAQDLDRFLEKVVDDHVRSGGGGGSGSTGGGEEDSKSRSFVDILLSVEEQSTISGFSMGRDGIKALLLDMFSAGSHTTFTVMDWTMTLLMRYPEVMAKVQAEVREIGRGKSMITEDDIEHMSYLKCVIKEVLRSHPPFPLLVPRTSIEDVEIQGYHIPKGTGVMINVWAISRDLELWERPDEFLPERFIDSPVDFKGMDFELIPFGAGRRGCPGILFASLAIELAVANLVHRFDWELPVGVGREDLDMTEATGLTSSRKFSLVLVARPHIG